MENSYIRFITIDFNPTLRGKKSLRFLSRNWRWRKDVVSAQWQTYIPESFIEPFLGIKGAISYP